MGVQERAEELGKTMFLGGPVRSFEASGRNQLMVLLKHGLQTSSKVLDVGCGCLRGGYWVMRILDPGCYHGIEPHEGRLRAGCEHIVEPDVLARAQPRFDHNDRFDFSVFGVAFDYVIARSVWTHAAKPQIEAMLDSFVASSTPNARFLTSVRRKDARGADEDYSGAEWVGQSHDSDTAGIVAHSDEWVTDACDRRGLRWRETGPNLPQQRWLAISRL